MKASALAISLILILVPLAGCSGSSDDDNIVQVNIQYYLECECQDAYAEYTTDASGSIEYGFPPLDSDGSWQSSIFKISYWESEGLSLNFYVADEDSNNDEKAAKIVAKIYSNSVVVKQGQSQTTLSEVDLYHTIR
jgi:hypothetical protein